eukprot:10650296-Lingulodinium_polyedra.AAC.1
MAHLLKYTSLRCGVRGPRDAGVRGHPQGKLVERADGVHELGVLGAAAAIPTFGTAATAACRLGVQHGSQPSQRKEIPL